MKKSTQAILSKMFVNDLSEFRNVFIDGDDGIEKHSIANVVQNLFPLLLKDLPQSIVDNLVS